MKKMLVALAAVAIAAGARAQVSVETTESKDKSATSSQVAINTGDHTFVPLTVSTQKTIVNAGTTRTESTTQARKDDGTYFDWQTTKSETKKLSDSDTEKTSQTVERDRQGAARVTESTTERITKSPDGTEHDTTSVYRRNSSGDLVIESQANAVSKTNPDGSISTTRLESRADASGALKPVERVDETTSKISSTESRTARTIQTFNHMDGGFTDSARDTTVVRKDGSATTTETVVQKPGPNGTWQNQSRITTTETVGPDGTVQREIVEQARPAYAPSDQSEALVPQQKTVEHEVKQADGSTVTQREVLHRDINGDWKPDTFSTAGAPKAP